VLFRVTVFSLFLINQDIGCGIGGPARAIARYSGASVTGLNICHYQVNRAKELTKLCGLQDLVTFKQVKFYRVWVYIVVVNLCRPHLGLSHTLYSTINAAANVFKRYYYDIQSTATLLMPFPSKNHLISFLDVHSYTSVL
jgi:trans-aconitate methyltransferase